MLLSTFKTRWNWTYEIIEDEDIDALLSSDTPSLLLAVVMTAVLVTDPIVIFSTFEHLTDTSFTKGKEAGDNSILEFHSKIISILEQAFVTSFRMAAREGKESIALCQAMFIYGVHCKTKSKSVTLIGGDNAYSELVKMMRKASLTSNQGREKDSQVRSRIFWNVAAQDTNFALYSLTKPALSVAELRETKLPEYSKNSEGTRQWRFILVWFRARICLDVIEIAHQLSSDGHMVQEALRRLKVTELLLPDPLRVLTVPNDKNEMMEARDTYVARTRYLIGMLYHKACESVTRLGMARFIPCSDLNFVRRICLNSAQQTIQWLIKGRGLAKNRGDLYCVWQLVPAPTSFLAIAVAILDEIRSNPFSTSEYVWGSLNSLEEALIFLDMTCDKDRSRDLLQSCRRLYHKLQRLVFADRPLDVDDLSTPLSRKEFHELLSEAGCHKVADRMLEATSFQIEIDAERWSELDQWLPLFLNDSL